MRTWRKQDTRIFLLVSISFLIGSFLASETEGKKIEVYPNDNNEISPIQEAINISESGDIIRVHNGNYNGSLVITKSISIFGNGTEWVTIKSNNRSDGILILANNVTLSGLTLTNDGSYRTFGVLNNRTNDLEIFNCTFEGFYSAIVIRNSERPSVNNTNSFNNTNGIVTNHINFGSIIDNELINNEISGIHLTNDSSNTIIMNNTILNADLGLFISNSNNSTISNNTISYSKGIGIHSLVSDNNYYNQNTLINNQNGIEIRKGQNNFINQTTIRSSKNVGVYLDHTKNNMIYNTKIINSSIGIRIQNADGNIFKFNTINVNLKGIQFEETSDDNQFTFNNIANNTIGVNDDKSYEPKFSMKNNWWGHSSGPFNSNRNEEGMGNGVPDSVAFDPWLMLPIEDEKPDLTFQLLNLTGNRSSLLSNQKVHIDIIIINSGNRTASSSTLEIYENNETVTRMIISTLNSGSTLYLTYQHQLSSFGQVTLTFKLDSDNQVIESDENNNQRMITFNSIKNISSTPSFSGGIIIVILTACIVAIQVNWISSKMIT